MKEQNKKYFPEKEISATELYAVPLMQQKNT
jgi:hypothetical protein